MLYAADLGPCGLDTSDLVNRDAVLDVYASQCSSCIDSTDPFLPEWSSYRVYSISKGNTVYMHHLEL